MLNHIYNFILDDDGLVKFLSNLPLYRDGLNIIAMGLFSVDKKIAK